MDDIKTLRKKKVTKPTASSDLPSKNLAINPVESKKEFIINDTTSSDSDTINLNTIDLDTPGEEKLPKKNKYNLSISPKHRSKKKIIIIHA